MKKIALITMSELPVPAILGGAVEELLTILIEENEKQHLVDFVVFCLKNAEAEEKAKAYKYTKIIYFPADSAADKVINRMNRAMNSSCGPKAITLIDIGYYRKVFDYLKKHPVDAIVAEGGKYQELRRFAEEFGKEKTYLHIHHHLLCEPYIDNLYGNVIATSDFIKNEWLRTTTDKTVKGFTVNNTVNEDLFNRKITSAERENLRETLGFSPEDIVVLYCGRLQEIKGVRELLKAMLMIENPHIRLLLIGSANFALKTMTPYTQEIKRLVDEAGERVKFTGYIAHHNLYQYYQCADFQVIPSLCQEAAGLVAIEGMLSGLPLIVTKSGGLVEYATDDVAIQIDQENVVQKLTQEIGKLAGNSELRRKMKDKSLEKAKAFPKKKFYEDYISVFEGEMGEK